MPRNANFIKKLLIKLIWCYSLPRSFRNFYIHSAVWYIAVRKLRQLPVLIISNTSVEGITERVPMLSHEFSDCHGRRMAPPDFGSRISFGIPESEKGGVTNFSLLNSEKLHLFLTFKILTLQTITLHTMLKLTARDT